jgi:hypothetical protein
MFKLTTLHFFTFVKMCLSLKTSFQFITLAMFGFGCKSKVRIVTCFLHRCENHLLTEGKINIISLTQGKNKIYMQLLPHNVENQLEQHHTPLFVHYHEHFVIDKYPMDWVHTQWKFIIEWFHCILEWVCRVVEKIVDDKWNIGKVSCMWAMFKHEMMHVWWTLDIPYERLLWKRCDLVNI